MTNENETVEQVCALIRSSSDEGFMIDSSQWAEGISRSDAIEFADLIEAAHKRELAAKDALIKALADALTNYMDDEWCDCATWHEREEANNRQEKYRALVAKAREVSNG